MEKKLTDEEIVKALELCVKGENCKICPYFIKQIDCVYHRRTESDALNLIHRLQSDNERLTEENGWLSEECNKSTTECAELQKQVDFLNKQVVKLHGCSVSIEELEQAVKDTAKEIEQELEDKGYFEYGQFTISGNGFIEIFKKRGVEVE